MAYRKVQNYLIIPSTKTSSEIKAPLSLVIMSKHSITKMPSKHGNKRPTYWLHILFLYTQISQKLDAGTQRKLHQVRMFGAAWVVSLTRSGRTKTRKTSRRDPGRTLRVIETTHRNKTMTPLYSQSPQTAVRTRRIHELRCWRPHNPPWAALPAALGTGSRGHQFGCPCTSSALPPGWRRSLPLPLPACWHPLLATAAGSGGTAGQTCHGSRGLDSGGHAGTWSWCQRGHLRNINIFYLLFKTRAYPA